MKGNKLRFILIYLLSLAYLLTALFLPQADTSLCGDLPQWFQNCKIYEDPDLTPIDFVTDHLWNIDSLFDSHSGKDQQKPHQKPITKTHSVSYCLFENKPIENHSMRIFLQEKKITYPCPNKTLIGFTSKLIKPPSTFYII